jgi:hypothetical protein
VTDGARLQVGQRIVVRTPDRHEYRGVLVELRAGRGESEVAVVRLDTGWLTSYPLVMVHPLEEPRRGA